MQGVLSATPNLRILGDEVVAIMLDGDRIRGVTTLGHGDITARSVVLTAGTFLRGTIHIGHETTPGGGNGQPASNALADQFRRLGLSVNRLKTGTPPRLDPKTVDYSSMTRQDGENPPPLFSWMAKKMFHVEQNGDGAGEFFLSQRHGGTENFQENVPRGTFSRNIQASPCPRASVRENRSSVIENQSHFRRTSQLPCFITHTTAETHRIVRDHLRDSALYGGDIVGVGARYCPSLEDKVVKFGDKESHHVFIEPESRDPALNLIYPNGLSCSLPRDVQTRLIASVPGLGSARIVDWAYAIEYDFYDPRDLNPTLESQKIRGLFHAGQINGTTGYEEAAAQGLFAGINAALQVKDETEFTLSRSEAYLGVLIDDLITKGTNEPYRMFTSRAERRLILRQDNARFRMMSHAKRIGIINKSYLIDTEELTNKIDVEMARLDAECLRGQPLSVHLCKADARYADLPGAAASLPPEAVEQIELRCKYRGYIEREERLAEQTRKQDHVRIPDWLDYSKIMTLRFEAREKLARVRPTSLGMAARIPGVNPADIAVLSVVIKRGR